MSSEQLAEAQRGGAFPCLASSGGGLLAILGGVGAEEVQQRGPMAVPVYINLYGW